MSINSKSKFYKEYERGLNSVLMTDRWNKLLKRDHNYPLFILTHPDMARDKFMAEELGVLDGINTLSEILCQSGFSCNKLATGTLSKMIQFGHKQKELWIVLPRYGFLFNPVRLYDVTSAASVFGGLPSIKYKSYDYWKEARWVDDLSMLGLRPASFKTCGVTELTRLAVNGPGWFIRNNLKSYKRYAAPLKSEDDIRQAINDALTAGHFVGDQSFIATEWIDIDLAANWHDLSVSDIEAEVPCEYRFHVSLHEGDIEIDHYHFYDEVSAVFEPGSDMIEFVTKCAKALNYNGLVSIDIARLTNRSLICIEVNCGESSGMLHPETYYYNFIKG